MFEFLAPLAKTDPPGLWFIFWWMQDAKVWAAILSFAIGLTGAVVGGWFSARAAKRARKHQIEDLRRAAADADARDLHSKFVELMSLIDQNPADLAQIMGVVSWYPSWKAIWTPKLRTDLRVGADVIPNESARSKLKTVIDYLNNARDLSSDGIWPGRPDRSLRRLVGMLAAEGVDIMSAYRRGDEHVTKRKEWLDSLAAETRAYAKWEADSEAASQRAAEEWWQGLTEEERQKAKEDQEEVIAALRAGGQKKSSRANRKAEPPVGQSNTASTAVAQAGSGDET